MSGWHGGLYKRVLEVPYRDVGVQTEPWEHQEQVRDLFYQVEVVQLRKAFFQARIRGLQ